MSNLIQTPSVHSSVGDVYACMSKRGSPVHYAVLRHYEDEGLIRVESQGNGPYSELVAGLPSDDARWILLNARYNTLDAGPRTKLACITWVPDAIKRATFRETVQVKSTTVMNTATFKTDMPSVVCWMQANGHDDLEDTHVLQRVSKFERGSTVDTTNVEL